MPKDKPGPNQTGAPNKVSGKISPNLQAKLDKINALSGGQRSVRLNNRLVRTKNRKFRMN